MPILASLVCGFVFGCGLVVSGMIQPTKVLGFLDFFGIPSGTWDPLCPGPAIVNLSTLSLPVIVFVIAMAIGMLAHDLWPEHAAGAIRRSLISPTVADG